MLNALKFNAHNASIPHKLVIAINVAHVKWSRDSVDPAADCIASCSISSSDASDSHSECASEDSQTLCSQSGTYALQTYITYETCLIYCCTLYSVQCAFDSTFLSQGPQFCSTIFSCGRFSIKIQALQCKISSRLRRITSQVLLLHDAACL